MAKHVADKSLISLAEYAARVSGEPARVGFAVPGSVHRELKAMAQRSGVPICTLGGMLLMSGIDALSEALNSQMDQK